MQEADLDGHRSAADLAVHNELGGFITIQLALEVLLAMRAGDGDERIHVAASVDLGQNATCRLVVKRPVPTGLAV